MDWTQIDVTDAGLFDKVVAYVALTRRESPATIKAEWRAIVAQAPLLFSGAPAIAVTARALDRFIVDPRILTLRVKGKDTPLKIGDLSHIDNLMVLVNRIDVTTPYPATGKP